MNIFNKITLKDLRKNRTRTIVTIIGVILAATMITSVTTFISSLQNYILQSEIANNGNWHLRYENMTYEDFREIKSHSNIENAYNVEHVGHGETATDHSFGTIFYVEGFSPEALENLPVRLQQGGRLPQNSNEIIIPNHKLQFGEWANLSLGDTIVLNLESGYNISWEERENFEDNLVEDDDGNLIFVAPPLEPNLTRTYTIVGIADRHMFINHNTLISKISDDAAATYTIYIRLNNVRNVFNFDRTAGFNAEQSRHQIHTRFNSNYLRAHGVGDNENMMAVIYGLAAILIILIMVGSVLLIYNSFAISVSERAKQFGILSSVGATSRQLRKSVQFEGIFVGTIGIPIGIIAGIGVIAAALGMLDIILGDLMGPNPFTLSISWQAIAAAILVGALTIFISAYIPAKKASRRSAIDTIRQSSDIKAKRTAFKTSRLTQKLFGLEGTLAAKNFKRNRKRYRATVISLFVSIVLFVAAGSFGSYLQTSADRAMHISNFDIAISFPENSNPTNEEIIELHSILKNADYVRESGYQFNGFLIFNTNTNNFSQSFINHRYCWLEPGETVPQYDEMPTTITFISDERYVEFLRQSNLRVEDYTGEGLRLPAVATISQFNSNTNRHEFFNIFNNINSLDIELFKQNNPQREGQSTAVQITLINELPDLSLHNFGGDVLIVAPYSQMGRFHFPQNCWSAPTGTITFMSNNPRATANHIEELIENSTFEHEFNLNNTFEREEENRRIMLVINIFVYGFIALMSLITVANVFNTISTSVRLRRREFAMIKSTGLTDRALNKMMNFECIFYGLKALLWGLPVSIGISWLIYQAVIQGIDVPFFLPLRSIFIAILAVFSIVFVTMMYSMRKIKTANIIDALRTDIA